MTRAGEPLQAGRRVLVSGATSTLGRMLCHELYHDDRVEHIVAIDDTDRPYYFADLDPHRFTYRELNILKSRQLSNLFLSDGFRRARIDGVAHLGFLKGSERRRGRADFEADVDATKNFLDRCVGVETVRRFVFLSGSLVYKLRPWNSVFIDEDADLNFDSHADPWTKARVDADMVCRSQMDNGRVEIVVFRPGPIIGNNISSHLNDLLSSWLVVQVAGYDPMIRPIHSRDVVRAFKAAVHAESARGVFNIAGRDIAPLSEFVRLARRRSVGLPIPMLRAANRLERIVGMTRLDLSSSPNWLKYGCLLDTRRVEQTLAFEPEHHVKFS